MRFDLTPPGALSPLAPAWRTSRWFNLAAGRDSLALEDLRGRVILLHAFQMLCPGCVFHGLPQAQRIAQSFAGDDEVAVIGLHTVFEHHAAMTPVSLEAFLHEHRIHFPVGVDADSDAGAARDPLPQTMRRYALQGTPSLVLIDRAGRLRRTSFGADEDLGVGAAIATLLAEAKEPSA
jgi:hypothetical protein